MPCVHRRCLTIQELNRNCARAAATMPPNSAIERFGDVGWKKQEKQTPRLLVRCARRIKKFGPHIRWREIGLDSSGSVNNSTRLSTRSGYLTANACAINPPIDHPITLARSIPKVSITRAASAASFSMSNDCPSSVEPPMPRLFSRISSLEYASRSMKDGSQSAFVAAKPFKTRSGRPFPTRR